MPVDAQRSNGTVNMTASALSGLTSRYSPRLMARIPRRWRALILTLLIGAAAAAAALLVPSGSNKIGQSLQENVITLDRGFYDWLFNTRGPEQPIPEVVIVEIDKRAIAALGGRYPFPRSYHARLIRVLKSLGARAIGFDMVFAGRTEDKDDQDFAGALRDSGNVVLGAEFTNSVGADSGQGDMQDSGLDVPDALFRDAALTFAPVDIPPDEDNEIRRFALGRKRISLNDITREEFYPGFAVTLAALYAYSGSPLTQLKHDLSHWQFAGHSIPRAPDSWGHYAPGRSDTTARICFAGYPKFSCRYLGYDQILDLDTHPEAMQAYRNYIDGKIVLIGSTSEIDKDTFQTPLRAREGVEGVRNSRPGVEVQANIIHTLLARHYYSTFPEPARKGLLCCLAMLTALITLYLRPTRGLFATALIVAAAILLDLQLFQHRWFMRPTEILVAIFLAYVGEVIFLYLTEETRAKEVRRHFGRYVGPQVLEKVLDSGQPALTGEIRHVAIMFTDVRGFTSLSESMSPADAVKVLNRYLTKMVDCIFKYDGTLDKIMGDGIMAYFGAPAHLENPELQSVLCAIEMQRVMQEWRAESERDGLPPIWKRIGIHAGEVIVGEVGSANQVGYTLIGDAVNVAARLEPLNKEYHTEILISDAIQQHLPESIPLVYQGEVPIRGRKEAIHAYSVQVSPAEGTAAPGSS